MYKWGPVAGLFVVLLVWACGCVQQSAQKETPPMTTPSLPEQYIAGEANNPAGSSQVTSSQTPANISSINLQSQVKSTLTEVTISCTGLSCTYENSTSGGPEAPVSSFSANPMSGLVPLTVQFTDTSANQPTTWLWHFGDGNVSTQENPVYNYTRSGVFPVELSVTNSYGTSNSASAIYVCPFVTSFTMNPTNGLVPLTVQFTDTSTGQPTTWLWNFGDGSSSDTQNPIHTFNSPGSYNVVLTTSNQQGSCYNSNTISVAPPVASFTANPTNGLVPLTVQFTDTSTDAPNLWIWSFGDGNTSTQQNPNYIYTSPGYYSVTLNVTKTSSNGISPVIDYGTSGSIQTDDIKVYSLPTVSFSATLTGATPQPAVSYNDKSTGFPGPNSWYWDFGDGFNSSYQNPSHMYAGNGSYIVAHSATNSQGTSWSNMTCTINIAGLSCH
jgi:PKD repeat protein